MSLTTLLASTLSPLRRQPRQIGYRGNLWARVIENHIPDRDERDREALRRYGAVFTALTKDECREWVLDERRTKNA